ncbi:hypothetical protein [Gordonia hydrophobica]|uniref:Integral membrane protein n=1 Tax=Gordonia hydrophobica TaxID=40516 RepID=A0ABZ2U6A1_9ACTN|nr:hypothetical protein [Gordonia hydrophobica]MBM7365426.1 hypothetical protein [Gordonia hydrophobica]
MIDSSVTVRALRESPRLIAQAVREATLRQAATAVVVAIAVAAVIGSVTVLIPNDVFGREIAPVAWNYPVLAVTAVLSGLLAATYVRPDRTTATVESSHATRPGRFGSVGVVVSWFAVGCPVCNKFALLALGYNGALSWFAPLQPLLAVVGVALLWTGLALRLAAQDRCPLPSGAAA